MRLSIYQYTDYRKFLHDYCADLLAGDAALTRAEISRQIGIKSPGHFSLILQGKANVSLLLAGKIGRFCRMRGQQQAYFLALVAFNQAKTHNERERAFEKVISFPNSCAYKVGVHQYRYFERWYHSVIRALCDFCEVTDNYSEIAHMVVPKIRADQVASSLRLLEELEMIALDRKGCYRPTQKSIDTGTGIFPVSLTSFALDMIDRAKESVDRFDKEERMLSWNTIGVNEEGFREIIEELRAFRLKVGAIAQKHQADRIYQINIQAFPLSHLADSKGASQ